MNLLKKFLVAASALLAIGTANAASSCSGTPCEITVGGSAFSTVTAGSFTDYFHFDLLTDSNAFGFLFSASFNTNAPSPILFDSVSLYSDAGMTSELGHWTINDSIASASGFLSGGDYWVKVTGTSSAGLAAYVAGISAIPAVPEPGEWAMILAGLGMVGIISRRRRSI